MELLAKKPHLPFELLHAKLEAFLGRENFSMEDARILHCLIASTRSKRQKASMFAERQTTRRATSKDTISLCEGRGGLPNALADRVAYRHR